MRCERLVLGKGDPGELAGELRALVAPGQEISLAVAEIIARVREEGDEAVRAYTRMLDTGGIDPRPLRVTQAEIEAATEALEAELVGGLELAIANVNRVAQAQAQRGQRTSVDFGGHVVAVREAPLGSAAVYVPGGRALYPSTVVMGVVTARAAGVEAVSVCSPPGSDGEVHAAVLGAAALAGASAAYRMGGAQAIAALAHGTESVAAVDVIVGPGNAYVQEAKRQVSGRVGIDGYAGPSDLVVLAGEAADPELVALDLLAQAEHGAGTLVLAISPEPHLLQRVQARLARGPETGAVARLVAVPDLEAGLALTQALAPEHLELVGRRVEPLADRITSAGCIFIGAAAGTAFGDYVAGSNHILPTGGSARFASGLSPAHFRRRFYEVRVTAPEPLARAAAPIARVEGFEMHAQSMEARAGGERQPPGARASVSPRGREHP
jgi:histidinol dehydrogenase